MGYTQSLTMITGGGLALSSPRNPLILEARRAGRKGSLTRDGYALAEGFHLLEDAVRARLEIRAVLATAVAADRAVSIAGARVTQVDDALFNEIAVTESSQGVIAMVRPPEWTEADLFRATPLVVILDGIQDPGNAGAIVRSAEAFSATGCIFLKGAVSPHNPKTLRAAAGSLFRLPVLHGVPASDARKLLFTHRTKLFAADPRDGALLPDVDLRQPFALVTGSEGHGVSFEMRAPGIRVPVTGVESLNAAMAAGVILYEASRQRAV